MVKCLTGAYRRDGGSIELDGEAIDPRDTHAAQKLGIGTVYQEVNLLPNLSVAENLYLGRQPRRFGLIDTRRMNADAAKLLASYGIDIDVKSELARYSVAIQQVVAIARAVDVSGKVLILDEPTASLDAQEVAMLFRIMRDLKARGLGIIFITHFLGQVYEIADRVTVLRNGCLVGSEPTATLDRHALISMMLGRDLEAVESTQAREGRKKNAVRYRFNGVGRRGHVQPFDLSIRYGEVVGMAGLLGSGRTETAETLFGIRPSDSGSIELDGKPARIAGPRDAIANGSAFALKTARPTVLSVISPFVRTSPWRCRRDAAGGGPSASASRSNWPIATSRRWISAPPIGTSRSGNCRVAISRR